MVKNLPANAETTGDPDLIPGWEDPLEKEMATHSSMLAWEFPWTEEPGGLQSMRLQSQTWPSACVRMYERTHTHKVTDENHLYSPGNSLLYGELTGKEIQKEGIYVYA